MGARCQATRSAPAGRRTRRPVKPRTVSVRQGLQIAHQRRAAAIELIQTLGGVAERDDVLHRLLVQATVRIARRQPLACGGGVARRQIATHGDYCQWTRLHHCGLQSVLKTRGAYLTHVRLLRPPLATAPMSQIGSQCRAARRMPATHYRIATKGLSCTHSRKKRRTHHSVSVTFQCSDPVRALAARPDPGFPTPDPPPAAAFSCCGTAMLSRNG
jgi:hypothetical protein